MNLKSQLVAQLEGHSSFSVDGFFHSHTWIGRKTLRVLSIGSVVGFMWVVLETFGFPDCFR